MTNRLSYVRRSLSATLMLAAGCAGDPVTAPDVDGDEPDTTAPVVVSTYPAANQAGVSATEKITLTFSEPMDPGTVESAWSSAQLPLDKVSFQWNDALTVLVISPDSPMLYAEGQGVDLASVPALTYAVTLGAGAADLAGNPIGTAMELSFKTKRRMTASFGLDLNMTRVQVTISSLGNTEIMIGDNQYGNSYRSYLTFDMATLPAGATIESAEFLAHQLAPEGSPYNLGPINVHDIQYSSVTAGTLINAQATSLPGMFSQDASEETKSIDVTSQVADDVLHRAERSDRSQYRLQIDQATNSDPVTDRAIFAKDTFTLDATYVVD